MMENEIPLFGCKVTREGEWTVTKAGDPTKELERLGWKFTFYGAEGKYFKKGKYQLQVIEQSEISPSVFNLNGKIDGTQNLHIWQTGSSQNLFFGYCHTIEDFKMIEKLLGILND